MSTPTPELSVLVVSYNTRELTLEALRALYEYRGDFEALVIDNASTDGSFEAIQSEFGDRAVVVHSADNLGFAGANNELAKRARGEYLLLLNPDTEAPEKAMSRLMAFAREEPRALIWGGRTTFADGSINPTACWNRMTMWSVLCAATGLSSLFRGSRLFNPEAPDRWSDEPVRGVDIVSGCFLLIRRELWERLDGFAPEFFMYGEEADLCLRARRLGARPAVHRDAVIVHHGGASEKVRADKLARLLLAKARLIRRHWSWPMRPIGYALLSSWPLTRGMAWTVVGPVTGRGFASAGTWFRAWRSTLGWSAAMRASAAASGQRASATTRMTAGSSGGV